MAISLPEYDISEERGFLCDQPPPPLGDYFAAWEGVFSSLPTFIQSKILREKVDSLPELDFSDCTLNSNQEWQRAYIILSFLGQGYMWMDGEEGLPSMVPKKLAVPWVAVSDYLGRKPVITYAAVVLCNYGLLNPAGPVELDNLYTLQTFTGTSDESWFFKVHMAAEMAAVPGLKAIASVFQHMENGDHEAISKCIEDVSSSLRRMKDTTAKMDKNCDPKTFFVKLRPFYAFPDKGIIYEGVDTTPRKYHGASAAQTSSVYAFDMFLGTQHSGKEQADFVMAMRNYMPRGHRKFLENLEKMPSVREYSKNSGNVKLISCYNEAVRSLIEFRDDHIILVTRYILNQKKYSKNPTLDDKGTAGAPLVIFLKQVRSDTEKLKIV